jgi:hypothetical protein
MLLLFRPLLFFSAVFLFAGCADLKGINKFSVNGAQVVVQAFPYGYSDYCYDSCYSYDTTAAVGHYPCDCAIANKYDTAIVREAGKLGAYFVALAKLSGSADVINVDTLAGAVVAGTYGKLTITSTDAAVVSGVCTAITDLATAAYKSKHLSVNLHMFGGAVDSALGSYLIHLAALDGQSQDLKLYLQQQLVVYRASAPRGYERWSVVYGYNQKIKDLMDRHDRFQKMIQLIQLIKNGYRELLAHADDIKSNPLREHLLSLVNAISYLSSSSKK